MKKYIVLVQIVLIKILILSLNFSFAQSVDSVFFVSYDEILKIIDGDTFKFKNTDKSCRLLCIDTEETYKGKNAYEKTNAITDIWPEFYYQTKLEKKTDEPIKLDSPFGYETFLWASDFFNGVSKVRLEYDDTLRTIDIYGRHLVYVFAEKNGVFVNYNLECVRQGFSPYFNKYGNSNRFHSQFVEAQEYAMKNRLGIWNPESKCYPDYEERLMWWNDRAKMIDFFNANYLSNDNFINLLNNDAESRLISKIDKFITVFGILSDVMADRFPYLLRMTVSRNVSVDLIIDQRNADIMNELDLKKMNSYYFYCSGKLQAKGKKYFIRISDSKQIKFR